MTRPAYPAGSRRARLVRDRRDAGGYREAARSSKCRAWLLSSRRRNPRVVRYLVIVDEVGRGEDEDLAHHVRALLVATHKADHAAACCLLDHFLKALARSEEHT